MQMIVDLPLLSMAHKIPKVIPSFFFSHMPGNREERQKQRGFLTEHVKGCQPEPLILDSEVNERYTFILPGHWEFGFYYRDKPAIITERLEPGSTDC